MTIPMLHSPFFTMKVITMFYQVVCARLMSPLLTEPMLGPQSHSQYSVSSI